MQTLRCRQEALQAVRAKSASALSAISEPIRGNDDTFGGSADRMGNLEQRVNEMCLTLEALTVAGHGGEPISASTGQRRCYNCGAMGHLTF